MIKVTFSFDTAEQAIEAIELLEGVSVETEGTPPAAAAPAAGRRPGRPRKTPPAPAADIAAPAAAAAAVTPAAPAAAAAATAAVVPFDDVAKHITDLAEANRAKAIEVLGSFGVKLASELKPPQFGPFVAACKAALAPAPNASLV